MIYIEALVYFKCPSVSSNDFIVFFIDSELAEVYANLPLKVFVDNPYRKFGRNRRNYWYVTEEIFDQPFLLPLNREACCFETLILLIRRRLAHQEVGENICQRSALSFIDPDQDQHFQDPDWKPYEYEDYHSAKG